MEIKNIVADASSKLLAGHRNFIEHGNSAAYPDDEMIIKIIDKLCTVVFPGYFNVTDENAAMAGFFWRRARDSNPRGIAPKRFSRIENR